MSTPTLRTVKAFAANVGAKVEDEKIGNSHECRVEAPHKFVWMCDGLHELVDGTNRPWKPDYADLISRMEYGLEPCTDPNCEWCNEV